MADTSLRRIAVFGNTTEFQSRNTHIGTVRWRTRFREEYANAAAVLLRRFEVRQVFREDRDA